LQDIKRNSVWASHLQSMVPRFDVVYSNNPLVVQLIGEAGIRIRKPPMYQRDLYSGTAIRKLMREKCDWSGLVPAAVAAFIMEVDGVERLISVSKSDDPMGDSF
jgi:nicotinamide-nucleotide adenylyltransferase